MFNPYAVRPIGSDQFLEHLKDKQTSALYYAMDKDEANVRMNDIRGYNVCRSNPSMNGWERLSLCITALAFIDYLESYLQKKRYEDEGVFNGDWLVWNSRCLALENEYFRKDPTLEAIFDRMLRDICWDSSASIEACEKRLERLCGW